MVESLSLKKDSTFEIQIVRVKVIMATNEITILLVF